MNYFNIENYFNKYNDYFLPEHCFELKNLFYNLDNDKFEEIKKIELIDPQKIQRLSIFCGFFGADRFAIDDKTLGFLKLFTFGIFEFGWILDISEIKKVVKRKNHDKILCALAAF